MPGAVWRLSLPLLALLLCAVAAGCGSSTKDDTASGPTQSQPSVSAADFPHPAAGSNLGDLQHRFPEGPNLAPSVSVLNPGTDRYGFALFDDARKQLPGAGVALYTARLDGTDVRGPYLARSESLAVKKPYESQTTAKDPDAAHYVYVADVPFRAAGKRVVLGVARLDGRMVSTSPTTAIVGTAGAQPPRVGQRVPDIHTPTLASVGGDAAKIDTRAPPATDLLTTDLHDVLGKKPVVLVLATPRLCASRVCGPVVDVEEQVRATTGPSVAFIHQEIYRDNDVSKGFTPQVAAFKLPTEPWTFVIDRSGRVAARFEGALSVAELQRAVDKVRS